MLEGIGMESCAVNVNSEPPTGLDARTLAACRNGDREAFRRLFEMYKDRVFSVAIYFLQGDVGAAEDITQEVFVRVFTHLEQFRSEAKFATWLYRLVANACMDEFRRRKRRPLTINIEEAGGAGSEQPSEVYARIEISEGVRAALEDLSPTMRLTILLRYFEELSYEEIAAILKCSQGTVASRLNRSLKTLAGKLKHLRDV